MSRRAVHASASAIAALVGVVAAFGSAGAWTQSEHRRLARRAWSTLMAEAPAEWRDALRASAIPAARGSTRAALAGGFDFVTHCVAATRPDQQATRFSPAGRTPLQQLRRLPRPRLAELVRQTEVGARRTGDGGPIECFLVHHLAALRRVDRAWSGDHFDREALRQALAHESVALGYLTDAFATGHLRPLSGIGLWPISYFNRRRAHDAANSSGLYLLDGRGEVWHGFGDRLLVAHAGTEPHVLAACGAALREVAWASLAATPRDSLPPSLRRWADRLADGMRAAGGEPPAPAAWREVHDAADYLEADRLASLVCLPMVTEATWSIRTAEHDAQRLRIRRHVPQLRDPGAHDPSLRRQVVARLPARADVPAWMVPGWLENGSAPDRLRSDPDVASVRWEQTPSMIPSYVGPVLHAGATISSSGKRAQHWTHVGLGAGALDDWPFLVQRLSVDAEWAFLDPSQDRGAVAILIGAGFRTPRSGIWAREPWRHLERLRFAGGRVWGVTADRSSGGAWSAQVELPAVATRATQLAVALRLGYWRLALDPHAAGWRCEVVIH